MKTLKAVLAQYANPRPPDAERQLRLHIVWLRLETERYLRAGVLPEQLFDELLEASTDLWACTQECDA